MTRKLAIIGALAGAAFAAAACGGGSSLYGTSASASPGGSTGAASPSPGSPAPSATVGIRNTPLGQILVDANGKTLYLYEADKGATSACYDQCASVWPPLTAAGALTAGQGVNQSLLSTTARKDGSMEVVYNGHPLYYFVSDRQAGDTTGQALKSFGADWYVLSAAGTKIDNG
jgi:predicted lipoprotein with Yx(FWY)xxD motif